MIQKLETKIICENIVKSIILLVTQYFETCQANAISKY